MVYDHINHCTSYKKCRGGKCDVFDQKNIDCIQACNALEPRASNSIAQHTTHVHSYAGAKQVKTTSADTNFNGASSKYKIILVTKPNTI